MGRGFFLIFHNLPHIMGNFVRIDGGGEDTSEAALGVDDEDSSAVIDGVLAWVFRVRLCDFGIEDVELLSELIDLVFGAG